MKKGKAQTISKPAKHQPSPPQKQVEQPKIEPKPAPAPATTVAQITTYDTINEAVHEYLLKSGLFKSVDTFRVFFIRNPRKLARIAIWKIYY